MNGTNFIDQSRRPMIFAHRGASAHAPENTLCAFQLAIEHQADAVELDAKLSADGHVVVIHDQTVDRTTDASGYVHELLLSTLQELDAGSFFHPRFAGERIPTLEQVFETIGKRIYINIELTNYRTPYDSLPERVAELVVRHGLEDRVIISSFLHLNIKRFHRLLPQVPVAILAGSGLAGIAARSFLGRRVSPYVIHPHFSDVNPLMMQKEKAFGRKVNAWTVNDPQEIKRLLRLDIDGIITDVPLLTRQIVEQYQSGSG